MFNPTKSPKLVIAGCDALVTTAAVLAKVAVEPKVKMADIVKQTFYIKAR